MSARKEDFRRKLEAAFNLLGELLEHPERIEELPSVVRIGEIYASSATILPSMVQAPPSPTVAAFGHDSWVTLGSILPDTNAVLASLEVPINSHAVGVQPMDYNLGGFGISMVPRVQVSQMAAGNVP